MLRAGAVLAALLLTTPIATAAQKAVDHGLGSLPLGKTVRMLDTTGSRLEAVLLQAGVDSVVLTNLAGTHVLSAAAVDSVWVRDRRTGVGALIGAGASLLTSYIALRAEGSCAQHSEWGGVCLFIMLGSAAAGAIIGAQIGSRIPRWSLRYVRSGAGAPPSAARLGRLAVVVSVQF